jgi:hypothetical protein
MYVFKHTSVPSKPGFSPGRSATPSRRLCALCVNSQPATPAEARRLNHRFADNLHLFADNQNAKNPPKYLISRFSRKFLALRLLNEFADNVTGFLDGSFQGEPNSTKSTSHPLLSFLYLCVTSSLLKKIPFRLVTLSVYQTSEALGVELP